MYDELCEEQFAKRVNQLRRERNLSEGFFDDGKDAPIRLREIENELVRLDADQLDAVLHLVSRMK